jgi:hypothetical protein
MSAAIKPMSWNISDSVLTGEENPLTRSANWVEGFIAA